MQKLATSVNELQPLEDGVGVGAAVGLGYSWHFGIGFSFRLRRLARPAGGLTTSLLHSRTSGSATEPGTRHQMLPQLSLDEPRPIRLQLPIEPR